MTEELIHTDYDPEFDFRDLPKVSLHDHLDGGLRPQTIIELAAEVNHKLPETEAEALGDWFRESANSGSLPRYLETFEHTLAVMQTREALIRVAREFVEDLAEDGVIYGEVRYAPEQHLREGLSLDDVVDAVQEGLDQACEALNAEGHPMQIGQVLSAMRQSDQSVEIAKLALRHRGHGVVAFDIAGPEDGFPPSRMKEAFDLLAENLFPTTIHAGEAAGLDSIKDAILVGRAQRLGHGVRVAEDIEIEFGAIDENGEELSDDTGLVSLGPVANWVRERGIPLEICPSSNLQTGATAKFGEGIRNHPIDLLVQTGFNVTISPDNRLMSGTSLSDEFELLVEGFDYDLEDLLDLTLNAAEAAFVPLEMRELLVEYINDYYDSLLDDEDEPGEFDEDEYENVAD